ncbi:vacuolar protein sorting protein-like protein [Xylona heveae TC161]|uniref:E3 ubiquitin-protein ligase PEP5 n=1 Tax=Xylona heveae (strain CBS 132557 / TC161) TaxID=1328760 RepID=A0A164ZSH8_XYLHT|nr:vacuolar protein sorting protein-like protein [Xylona heveae TC161]KZF19453.1 vacuolar protein sorting protein-like protein [Xylona heveae TC161]
MSLAWKTFNFFEVSQIQLPTEGEGAPSLDNNELSCICTGSEAIFLGGADGVVRILSSSFRIVRSFRAYDTGSITHMKQIDGTSLLLTVAEDLSNEPELKVWALDKTEKKTGHPKCQSTVSIQNGRRQFPISALATLDDLSQVAVGFANGSVTVIRGDLIHDRGTKQRTVFESEEPITGVDFREGSITTLYIATTARILTLVISGRGQGQPARVLEERGCGVGCMTVDKSSGEIVVAREDAIYHYGVHGRLHCLPYDGPKKLVSIYKDYIGLVSPPRTSSSPNSSTARRFGGSKADELFNTSSFVLLDTALRFVTHSESLVSQVKAIFAEWGDLFLLTMEGKLYRYHEKSFKQKLEILYGRNMYTQAISLAQKARVDISQQNVIFRRYGDYLYQKGEYDAAMQQYLKAIDNTEPSQVIRKFLDTQKMHNLIEYLEELHEHHRATADHTTLLLNCYAKLKDVTKLEKFIKSPGDLKFDLDTAIVMCRQGGYFEQAAYLATKHGEHELVVDILIEDSKKYAEALEYIWRLEPDQMYPNLMKYARVLLGHCPRDTTQLFIDYYTGKFRPKRDLILPDQPAAQSGVSSAVQSLAAFLPLPYMTTFASSAPGTPGQQPQGLQGPEVDIVPEYEPAKPRSAFSCFVDHPDEFIVFMEACLRDQTFSEEDKIDLYTTLFEMYLHSAKGKREGEKSEWQAKAKRLIDGEDIPIDPSNVLLLSYLSSFRDGSILVREQQGLYFDIFRSYTSANDTEGAIRALKKYGPEEPQLYPAALAYFTSNPRILAEAGDELEAVLKKIDEDGLMAPLQVIQTLSVNAVATMGLVKKYLRATIESERKEINNNRRLIESYRSETEAKRKEIDELGTKPAVFQSSRCAECGGTLDLPKVHFMCKHSFHQRCLNQMDDEVECPVCAPQNATIRAIRRAQDESADKHEMFRDALQRSSDKFGTISEFFGRGVMSVPTLE